MISEHHDSELSLELEPLARWDTELLEISFKQEGINWSNFHENIEVCVSSCWFQIAMAIKKI